MSDYLVRVAPNQLRSFKAQSKALAVAIADTTSRERIKTRRMHDYLAMGCGYTSYSQVTVLAKGLPPADSIDIKIFTSDTVSTIADRISGYLDWLSFDDVKHAITAVSANSEVSKEKTPTFFIGTEGKPLHFSSLDGETYQNMVVLASSGKGRSVYDEFPDYVAYLSKHLEIDDWVAKYVMGWHTQPGDKLRQLRDQEGVIQRASWHQENGPYCVGRYLDDPWELFCFEPSNNGYVFDHIKPLVQEKGINVLISEDGMRVTGYHNSNLICTNTLSERKAPISDSFLICRMWVAVAILTNGTDVDWAAFIEKWKGHFDEDLEAGAGNRTFSPILFSEESTFSLPKELRDLAKGYSASERDADMSDRLKIEITFYGVSDEIQEWFWSLPYMTEFKSAVIHRNRENGIEFSIEHHSARSPRIAIHENLGRDSEEAKKTLESIPSYKGLATATTYSHEGCDITFTTRKSMRNLSNQVHRIQDFFTDGLTTNLLALSMFKKKIQKVYPPSVAESTDPSFEYDSVTRTGTGYELEFIKNGSERITRLLSSEVFETLTSIPFEAGDGDQLPLITYRDEHTQILRKLGCLELTAQGNSVEPAKLTNLGCTLVRACHEIEEGLRKGTVIEAKPMKL